MLVSWSVWWTSSTHRWHPNHVPMEIMGKWFITQSIITVWSNNKLLGNNHRLLAYSYFVLSFFIEWLNGYWHSIAMWWGFSFAQTCPLGFQRPTRSFLECFNASEINNHCSISVHHNKKRYLKYSISLWEFNED